jgi:hypothetical protein
MRLLLAALFSLLASSAHAAYQFTDIACETSTTSGTGTLDLAGAKTGGYLGFAAAGITSGNTVPYTITIGTGATRDLETGFGVFTDAATDTLTRVAQWSTDGSGAELNLSGTSTICIGPIAGLFTLGAGSTVDADKLDGISSADFLTEAEAAAAYEPLGVTLGTDTTGDYVAGVADGTGIDGTASGEGSTYTPTFDATELTGTTTFGAGAAVVVASDLQSTDDILVGDDVTLSAVDGIVSIGTDTTFTRVDASDSLVINTDTDNDGASSVISLGVDGNGEALLSGTAFYPGADGGSALGINDTNEWNGLYLNSDTAISWAAGDVTITHSANDLAFAGVTGDYSFDDTVGVTGSVTASVDVTATAGDVTSGDDIIAGDDVLLSDTGVINFNSGDCTLTEGTDTLTIAGTCTLTTEVVVPDGDNTRNLGSAAATWAATHTTTIELGDNTDTTIARSGAGTVTIEGNAIATFGTGVTGTLGTLELGSNGTDTTFARTAAGEASIEGDVIKHAGRQTISLLAGAGTLPTGGAIAGCTPVSAFDSGSNDVFLRQCSFSASADNAIYFTFAFPKSATESTDLVAQVDWTSATTTDTTDDVIWTASAVCFSNDDAINGNAFPAVDTVTDTQTAAGDFLRSGEITAITPAGTPAEGDACVVRFTRDADAGGDNFNGTAEMINVQLYYVDSASSDD